MARIFNILLLLALSFSFCANAITIEDIKANLKDADIYKVEYKQIKELSSANTSLESDGYIILKKNALAYAQVNPFSQLLVMTNERLLEIVDGDISEISKDTNPEVFEISSLLLKVFSFEGDYTKYFDVELQGTLDNWTAKLTPKDTTVKKIFKMIVLTGANSLKSIEIYDNNDDLTKLLFENYVYENIQDEMGVLKYLE